jgi:hypothetical protein
MVAGSVQLLIAYMLFGLVACLLARKGWPEDWDETLLASILGPPLLILLALALAAGLVWERLGGTAGKAGHQRSKIRL